MAPPRQQLPVLTVVPAQRAQPQARHATEPLGPAPRHSRWQRARDFVTAVPQAIRSFVDVRQARAQGRAPATLPLLSIEVTVACNARCGMCGYPSDYPVQEPELTTQELFNIVDEAKSLGALVISLGGGEPFLRDDTEALIRHIGSRGIVPFVHTNGSLLNLDRCRRLGELSRLTIALSLDSHRRETHDRLRKLSCFDNVSFAARYFAKHAKHVRVIFTFTITAQNYRDIVATTRLARDLGVRTIRFTPFHENLQHRFKDRDAQADYRLTPEMAGPIREQLAQASAFAKTNGMITNSEEYFRNIPSYIDGHVPHRCFAGFFFASIDPAGNIFPCYDHVGDANIRRAGGLRRALFSPEMQKSRERVLSCQNKCWNVGTAEPSLRLGGSFAKHSGQLVRESLFFLT